MYYHKGRLELRGNDAFCVTGNWGKLKDAATRCVLRHVGLDASKCVCSRSSVPGPAGGQRFPDRLARFGGGVEGKMETARTRKGPEGEGKEREKKRDVRRVWK